MSVDDWSQEHHLTPSGWVKGTYKYYGKGTAIPRPADAVETWEEHCTQSSAFSREHYTHAKLWSDPNISETERRALVDKFPPPFDAKL
jgi:hypothetical protein